MSNIQNLQNIKNKIISTIQTRGPSLPIHISKVTSTPSLFTSAYLSELVSDNKLKISNMKVGASPIYYLQGQENKLEKFSEYLNSKEKEAFHLLNQHKVLEDQKQHPAIRVALRQLKDFAIPTQAKIDGELKLFWKYYLLPSDQTRDIIQNLLSETISSESNIVKTQNSILSEDKQVKKLESINTQNKTIQHNELIPIKIINPKPNNPEVNLGNSDSKNSLDIFSTDKNEKTKIKKQPQKQKSIQQDSDFTISVKSHLEKNSIKILEEISSKKKEYTAKVQHFHQLFGNQSFFLIAKDKKKVTENDLVLALQKSQSEKMPAFLLSPGELDKKAQVFLEEWKNVVKFHKLKN